MIQPLELQTAPVPYFDLAATRAIETNLLQRSDLHAAMALAGDRTAQLVRSVAPHARTVWVACGPGNNGGDGLVAAKHLSQWLAEGAAAVWLTLHANPKQLPADARWALEQAVQHGLTVRSTPPNHPVDVGVDALLGIGGRSHSGQSGHQAEWARLTEALRQMCSRLVCVDTPSELNPFTGALRWPMHPGPNRAEVHTLTFLGLKPGLVTGNGRDHAGTVWLDDLDANPMTLQVPSGHWLPPCLNKADRPPLHSSHKGTHGDVWVLGGSAVPCGQHMLGAVVLAARSALLAGAGRVTMVPLAEHIPLSWDPLHPELMVNHMICPGIASALPHGVWVVGCGGGDAVSPWLSPLMQSNNTLVLDADALNAVAKTPELASQLARRAHSGPVTVLTPHPLEAARLLDTTVLEVQKDRLVAAQAIAERFQSVCVLKGSGTVVASPFHTPLINGSGNGKLATAGTGDVLAGLIGGTLARHRVSQADPDGAADVMTWVSNAVHAHGKAADEWPSDEPLLASRLPAKASACL